MQKRVDLLARATADARGRARAIATEPSDSGRHDTRTIDKRTSPR